jgi:hypothetical protein
MSEHAFELLVGWATVVLGLATLCQIFIAFSVRRVVRQARTQIEDVTHRVVATIDASVTALHENRTQIAVLAESTATLYRNVEQLAQQIVKPVEAVIRTSRFIRKISTALPRRGRRTLSSRGGEGVKQTHNPRTALGRVGN